MSQKYVTDGAWLVCTEGKLMQKLKVESQTTVYMYNKLAGTNIDRTGGNFNCLKMATIGALVGAAVAAVFATAALLTGGFAIGLITALALTPKMAFVGALFGTAISSFMPCICSLLTRPSMWINVHDQTLIEGKQALLENAVRPCLLGGMLSIVKTDINMAIDMAELCNNSYFEDQKDNNNNKYKNENWECLELDNYPDGLKKKELWKEGDGFRAFLYKDKKGRYAVVFKGSDENIDFYDDAIQAFGLESSQYKKASELAKKIKDELPPNTIIAGHSLGGGLATLVGAETGMETYTYNAAGVHPDTYKRYNIDPKNAEKVNAYSSDDDPLSIIQDNRVLLLSGLANLPSIPQSLTYTTLSNFAFLAGGVGLANGGVPRAGGKRIGLETHEVNPKKAHSVDPIIGALKEEKKVTPTINVITEKK